MPERTALEVAFEEVSCLNVNTNLESINTLLHCCGTKAVLEFFLDNTFHNSDYRMLSYTVIIAVLANACRVTGHL